MTRPRAILRRLPNWPELLAAEIAAAEARPFAWGSMDCALFVCDCILAITGEDVAAKFRGRYKTERGANSQWARRGYPTFLAIVIATLGEPLQTVRLAQRGDVVLIEGDLGFATAIVDLNGRDFVGASAEGLHRFPIGLAKYAWRVGE